MFTAKITDINFKNNKKYRGIVKNLKSNYGLLTITRTCPVKPRKK